MTVMCSYGPKRRLRYLFFIGAFDLRNKISFLIHAGVITLN